MSKASDNENAVNVRAVAAAIPEHHCDNHVGERVKQRREELGLTPEDLVYPGCRYKSTEGLENRKNKPSLKVIIVLSLLLNLNPEYLERGSEPKELNPELEVYLLGLVGFKRKWLLQQRQRLLKEKAAKNT